MKFQAVELGELGYDTASLLEQYPHEESKRIFSFLGHFQITALGALWYWDGPNEEAPRHMRNLIRNHIPWKQM